jgi:methionine-rich copper-binding protein CopC
VIRIVLLVLLAGLAPRAAGAHAFLDHAEPRVGSSVDPGPRTLTLFFTEPIEAAFSRVEVEDERATKLSLGPPEHPSPATLALPLPALPPGEYTVHWAVVSVDTHSTEGSFRFSVKTRP